MNDESSDLSFHPVGKSFQCFLEDYDVDAALWVGCPGSTGCNAIGEVLAGLVNPSGRTTDTFPYEVESAPSYYSFGDYSYSNATYTNESLFGGTGTAGRGTAEKLT